MFIYLIFYVIDNVNLICIVVLVYLKKNYDRVEKLFD